MTAISFPRALADVVATDPDAVAVVCGEQSITRSQLDRASNQTARVFADRGVEHGDFVTIGLPNGIEFLVACMAAWKLGAVPNPVSPALPAPERDAIIERADPALVVGIDPSDRSIPSLEAGHRPAASVSDAALPDRVAPIERALTSGGSTGRPKLILTATPAVYDPASPLAMFAARRAMLVPGPMYHGIPFASAWRSIFAGAKVVVMERFDAARCIELIAAHRVDRVSFVPTMMLRLARLDDELRRRHDISSLEFVLTSGSPCPPWLMQFWIDWVGPEVMHESFGSTERIGGTFITGSEWLTHPGSVGRAVGGSRIRILDPETLADRPTGEIGEIYMMPPTGPGSSYQYVGAERRVTTDGWESVGDMGYLDDEGYLYLADRRDDMILVRGRNVFPAEVEAAIESHPNVRSSAVIGLPDDDRGSVVHAIVEASGVTADELATHVAGRLVHYKVPKSFELVDHALRDDSGKVRRSALRHARLPKPD